MPRPRLSLSLLPIILLSLVFPPPLTAQQPQGWIEVTRPAAWAGAGTRGIAVNPRESIRIEGLAGHPSGVQRVLIDNQRAGLEARADGRYAFVGYAVPTPDVREVEIAVYPAEGPPVVRKFAIEVRPAGERATPESALSGGERARGQRWAVVVGVSAYADARIPDLSYADADARAFHSLLLSERTGLGGFDPDNVLLLTDERATLEALRTAFYTFLRSTTEDDIVVIYFAGHGAPDPYRPDDLYLLTHDADVDNLPATAFPMEEVMRAVKRAYARDVLVITDACHSAGAGGQTAALRSLERNPINRVFLDQVEASTGGIAVFTASEAAQFSHEGRQWGGGHGIFTYYLVRALEGHADADGDRIVTLGETIEWVRDRVRRETGNAQIPSVSQTAFDRAWPLTMVVDPPSPLDAPIVAGGATEAGAAGRPESAGREEAVQTPLQPGRLQGVEVAAYATLIMDGIAGIENGGFEAQVMVPVRDRTLVGAGLRFGPSMYHSSSYDDATGSTTERRSRPTMEYYLEGRVRMNPGARIGWWLGPHVGYTTWDDVDLDADVITERSSASLGAASSLSVTVGRVDLDLGGVLYALPAGWTLRAGIRPRLGGPR